MIKEKRKLKHGGRRHVPMPKGPYPVGCVDIMTGYSKSGCFVRLFYPTAQKGSVERKHQWPTWLPHESYLNGYAQFLGVWPPMFKVLYRIMTGNVYIPAVWDAMPLQEDEAFPVIVFSHGLAGCRTLYASICLELASQGYIVAAVEHRDNSACHSFYMKERQYSRPNSQETEDEEDSDDADGKIKHLSMPILPTREWVVYRQISIKKKEYAARNKQLHQRAQECIQALDLLEALNNGYTVNNVLDPFFKASKFKGTMDLSRAAVAGHSFGGATVILTLALELRFKLGLALDTWMVPLQKDDDVMAMVSQPILFVNMEKFQTKDNLQLMSKLETYEVERKVITIKGTGHLNQCDLPFICGYLTRVAFVGFTRMDRFTAMDITTRLMLEFLGRNLDMPIDPEWLLYLEKKKKKLKEGINLKRMPARTGIPTTGPPNQSNA